MNRTALLWIAVSACTGDPTGEGPSATSPTVVHLGEHVDDDGVGEVVLENVVEVELHLDGEPRIVELSAATWTPPRPLREEVSTLDLATPQTLTIAIHGPPAPPVERSRSLVWTNPAIVDDPAIVGLGRVLRAASGDHGGTMLDQWFRRFATTIHSERAGPAQLMDEIAAEHGDDPATWDLDELPFVVTAVHNRLDLGPRGGGCGELRVSFASTHDVYAPLHLLFLFRQEPLGDDLAPDGTMHCLGTARRWARLSELDEDAFVAAARGLLDATLTPAQFLLAESVELTVSPWEWRQWTPTDGALDNPPLFQTVATPLLNQPGPLRDDFLAFVEENAAALDARTLEIPAAFRVASARVPPSVPAERLDLDGLPASTVAAYPSLRDNIEIVGCPACHTHDAEFLHTLPDRSFSDFYDRELDARASYVDALNEQASAELPPFGPLQ